MKKKPTKPAGEFTDKPSQHLANQDRLLFGEVPEKFSPRRLLAAQALGFRFLKLNDAERAQLNDDNYIYDGMVWDATLCAFLCTCKPVLLFKAVRIPETVIELVMAWGDQHNVFPGSSGFKEVMEHFTSVMEAMIRSSAEQVDKGDKKSGNEGGEALLPGE